ncbi:hypothetical protein EZS27_008610 [termite gut metagenome]|uniref:Uncharacterized protein n=1 Tax=termite gut metagenome TaxID=433724 RepID=A0A5J4SDA0_9ZZZZ
MNRFRQVFGNITESDFNSFSADGYKILYPRLVRTFGVGFSGGEQSNPIISQHLFGVIIRIGSIRVQGTSLRQVQWHLFESLHVVVTTGVKVYSTGIPSLVTIICTLYP